METKHRRHTVHHAFCGRLAVVAIAWAVASVTDAEAQTTSKQESKWDVAFVAGYLGVRPEIELQDRYADRWYDAGQAGVTFGRYFMPHLKAEVELSTSTEGRQWITGQVPISGVSYPVPYVTERVATLREISGALVYQFFDNEWAHPFVFLGIAGDFDRVRSYTPRRTFNVGDPRLPNSPVVIAEEIREGPETTTRARLLFGGGAKLYFTQRAFVRTDGRFATDGSGRHLAFRIGVGVDF
jgi:hypothetical protein